MKVIRKWKSSRVSLIVRLILLMKHYTKKLRWESSSNKLKMSCLKLNSVYENLNMKYSKRIWESKVWILILRKQSLTFHKEGILWFLVPWWPIHDNLSTKKPSTRLSFRKSSQIFMRKLAKRRLIQTVPHSIVTSVWMKNRCSIL